MPPVNWRHLNNEALHALRQGEHERARDRWMEALELLKGQAGGEQDMVILLDNLGRLHARMGEYAKAEEYLDKCVRLSRLAFGLQSPNVARALEELANLYQAMGRDEEAAGLYTEVLTIWRSALHTGHLEIGRCHKQLAESLKNLGQFEKAEGEYRSALRIYERSFGPNHPEVARILSGLATTLLHQEKYDETGLVFRREFEIWKTATKSKRPDIAKSLNDLALLYYARGDAIKAERAARSALEMITEALGAGDLEAGRSWNILGICTAAQSRFEDARTAFAEALRITQRVLGEKHPRVEEILANLALAERRK